MDGFSFDGFAGGARRGTAPPSSRVPWELGADVFAGKDVPGPQLTGETQEDISKHLASAAAWMRTSPCRRAPAELTGFKAADATTLSPLLHAPPAWTADSLLLPSSRLARIAAPPAEARDALRRFFACGGVRCEVREDMEAWTFSGTGFVDYVAVAIDVAIYESSGDRKAPCVVVFRHPTARDVVRFSSLVGKVVAFLGRTAGLSVQAEWGASPALLDDFDDFDFESDDDDDDIEEEEEMWGAKIDAMLQGASSGSDVAREEAWETLAAWGAAHAESRPDLARALLVEALGSGIVARTLSARPAAPLAEVVPMAVAVKYASLGAGPDVARAVSRELMDRLAGAGHFPALAAAELREASAQLLAARSAPPTGA